MSKRALSDVFTPGGLPSVTYVSRDHLKLEKVIGNAVIKRFAINVVTGPTKSGKSVLCHRVLSGGKLITVEGGQVQNEAEFWTHIAHQLNIAATATRSGTTGQKIEASGTVGWNLGATLTAAFRGERSEEKSASLIYTNVLKLACIKALIDNKAALLVDDFHYFDATVQKAIIQGIKGPVMQGLTVFLLAVPHRAFDPITVENEVEGRFKHIEIPPWDLSDLMKIPEAGFPALNTTCDQASQERMCHEAFGNPLLVQEACSELCLANDVVEEQEAPGKTLDTSLLDNAFAEIAKSKGFPKFQKLKKGPQARKARRARAMRDQTEQDIYSALMMAVARIGPKAVTSYDEIRASLKDLIAEGSTLPQKNEITSALNHMTLIARKDIKGEPPLEWVKDENELVITDPFLLFYMKYAFPKSQSKVKK